MTRPLNPPPLPDIDDSDGQDSDAESGAPEQIETETGVDLSEASELDADHVLADEEAARVVQAPD
ncbi:MAG: hypothetical protein EOO29_00435 [Comamonadaceae bacterium]|nr:MAG: hypothetical protein EOO29_00435 [Comamonadaceae bacterium]